MTKEIRLTELINVDMLQKIQDAFANATGMAALTVDLNGAVTQLSNPTEFCMKLTRGCPKGAERCNQCDLSGGEQAARTGKPSVYFCHGGLMDFAAPILINGKQIGSLIGGQVLPEPPNEAKFRKIAREIGINEDEYIKALSKIRIVPKKNIEASAQLLFTMANALSDMGYQKHLTHSVTQELINVASDMYAKVQIASENIFLIKSKNDELLHNMDSLFESTSLAKGEVENTNKIVKYINDVSMQTKLLGFNASVEASRSREYGAGFNVIAQEIRKLADTSQQQFNKIDTIINSVKSTIFHIDGQINNTSNIVNENTKMLQEISEIITEINNHAKKLEEIGNKL